MKDRNRKRYSLPNRSRKNPEKNSLKHDPFFNPEPKRRKTLDEDLDSGESDDDLNVSQSENEEEEEEESELNGVGETVDEIRHKEGKAFVEKLRLFEKQREEEEGDVDYSEGEREGRRDSLIAERLLQEQLEESGRVQRFLASRVLKAETPEEFRVSQRHRQSVTAVSLTEDDSKGFSASKDGTILHWDIDSGKSEKYLWPSKEVLRAHGAKSPQNPSMNWSKHILALAVSSDGRYLATGGLDRHIHLWDTRTREHIQAFPGHRGPVSCLVFRQGTSQLMSGSFDRTIKLWNIDDRTYMDTLFGHQSEVLTIDCLRKERILTVGRDRTMRLWKVPEESQLVFRAPTSSLECGCFINNEEFLSGSDDGSIELWSLLRKKPVHILKNAHAFLDPNDVLDVKSNGRISDAEKTENGLSVNASCSSSAQSWVGSVAVCRGTDLAASGAANGVVRLWAIESEAKSIKPLYDLPLIGFVNSLVFAKSGRFLVAGVGQEPRLGRWGRVSAARNGVAVQSIKLSDDTRYHLLKSA